MTPEPAQPAEAWLNDPASLESGEPAQPAESPEARAKRVLFDTPHLDGCEIGLDLGPRTNLCSCDQTVRAMLAFAASTARPTERGAVEDGHPRDSFSKSKARLRLERMASSPDHWRHIYDKAVSPDPLADLARDIRQVLGDEEADRDQRMYEQGRRDERDGEPEAFI